MEKKIVYIDMDNVLVNFQSGLDKSHPDVLRKNKKHLDEIPGLFSLMDPMPEALESIEVLKNHFDVYILSTAPWKNPSAWSDKLLWVHRFFGMENESVFYKRLILTHHKELNIGDYLIDDRTRNGADQFKGELIQFGSEQFPDWKSVVEYLLKKENIMKH